MATPSFLARLDSAIGEHAVFGHPFYQAWSRGALSLADIQEYSKQYYHFEKAFPTFVSGVHSNTEDPETRHQLLLNLIEEEHGENNHPELWLRFAESLGVDREDVRTAQLNDATKELLATFRRLTRDGNTFEGLAALYAYESQIPENSRAKIDGLIRHYGITSDDGLSFFRVHEEADEIHSRSEREHLAGLIRTAQDEEQAIESARVASIAIYNMLTGIDEACKKRRKEAELQS